MRRGEGERRGGGVGPGEVKWGGGAVKKGRPSCFKKKKEDRPSCDVVATMCTSYSFPQISQIRGRWLLTGVWVSGGRSQHRSNTLGFRL
jgi:hypothetical protein